MGTGMPIVSPRELLTVVIADDLCSPHGRDRSVDPGFG